jgi:hypothetical protein
MRPRLLLAALALLGAGCATLEAPEAPFRAHLESVSPPVRECAQWYRDLDARVAAAGVRDAQDSRIAGFPYLRVNRLLAALRSEAATSGPALQALVQRMLRLDQEARRFEILNLPAAAQDAGAQQRTQHCGRLLREIDLAKSEVRAELLRRAQVDDDYSMLQRVLGAYALTRVAFADGVRRYEAETSAAFRGEPALRAGAHLVRVAPPPVPPLPHAQAAEILRLASGNELRIPEPDASHLEDLLAVHAPSFEIEVAADYDRFGEMRWLRGEAGPSVDGSRLVVYGHAAWTRYRGRVLLQLVYTIWFSERPPQSAGDILAGKLDGLTWRVTLAPDGEPLLYDTIHPCGCFHLFFPTPRATPLPAPDALEEWMFAPHALPRIGAGERPLLRIASGTHYLERVSIVQGSDSLARYEILPYNELRSLARLDGGRASAFGPDGLVAVSERPERLLFWPMGIRSAGAMRQWGRQATAFVGRRHFDDADLLEKRFLLELPAVVQPAVVPQ